MSKKLVSVCLGLGLAVLGTLSSATVVNSQAFAEYLRPGERRTFKASRPTRQWNYSQWKSCFSSASRRSRNARVNVRAARSRKSYNYSASRKKCVVYRPTGSTWVITNTGNTTIQLSITPSYR